MYAHCIPLYLVHYYMRLGLKLPLGQAVMHIYARLAVSIMYTYASNCKSWHTLLKLSTTSSICISCSKKHPETLVQKLAIQAKVLQPTVMQFYTSINWSHVKSTIQQQQSQKILLELHIHLNPSVQSSSPFQLAQYDSDQRCSA